MPLDGFTLGLIARELNATLAGGRVDRVIQPERDDSTCSSETAARTTACSSPRARAARART